MWEVQKKFGSVGTQQRITPTYVGSTLIIYDLSILNWDHPHVCGKYYLNKCLVSVRIGSPPRMWEVRCMCNKKWPKARITPTYVGSTQDFLFPQTHPQDHPHVCGKYFSSKLYYCWYLGSPPRMWEVQKGRE